MIGRLAAGEPLTAARPAWRMMGPAVVVSRNTRTGTRSSPGAAIIVAAVLLVAVALGALVLSTGDEQAPAAAEFVATPLAPSAAPSELPRATEPAPAPALPLPPVEPLAAGVESASAAFRGKSQVLSTWGAAPGDVRAPCTLIVIDDLDQPVPGATVRLWGDDQPSPPGHVRHKRTSTVGPYESTTGADGRCEVRPPPYRPRAQASKEGIGCSKSMFLSADGGADQCRVVLVPLTRLAHLRGRVVEWDGSPAPNVKVSIDELVGEDDSLVFVVTDAGGGFERDVPGGGRVKLRAVVPGTSTCEYMFEARAGATCEALLRLPGDWGLSGRLLQADGTPVPEGAKVEFWPDPRAEEFGFDTWMHDRDARTDDAGRFEIRIEQPTNGQLTASGAGFAGLAETSHAVIDTAHPKLDVTLRACAPGSVAGRVVDEAGGPLEGVSVWASAEATRRGSKSGPGPSVEELYPGAKTSTGDDGSFKLAPLHPQGLYTVMAQQAGTGRVLAVRHVAPGADDLVLALGGEREQHGSLVLVVSEAESGQRVDQFQVTYLQHADEAGWNRRWQRAYQGTSGIAELDRQPTGLAYDLLVSGEGLGCAFVSDVTASIGGTTVKVALPALGSLEFDVTDGGAPAAWAIVEAERSQSAAESEIHVHSARRVRADERGHARLSDLEPGRYALRATHGGRSVVRQIEVAPGTAAALVVDLP
jgi:protocatechuate 3,4-dioxygenase beta subunit